jgi:hypothetical protein
LGKGVHSRNDGQSSGLEPTDPPLPWLFTTSSLLRVLVIPGEYRLHLRLPLDFSSLSLSLQLSHFYDAEGLIYAIFHHNFGEDDCAHAGEFVRLTIVASQTPTVAFKCQPRLYSFILRIIHRDGCNVRKTDSSRFRRMRGGWRHSLPIQRTC